MLCFCAFVYYTTALKFEDKKRPPKQSQTFFS